MSKYAAETLRDPPWMAIRLVGSTPDPQESKPLKKTYWVWMFPPSRCAMMRDALGPLAWGRMAWPDAMAETISHGAIAEFCKIYEDTPSCRDALSHIQIERIDGSHAPEHTKHGFSPLCGRAGTNIAPIAWATLKLSKNSLLPMTGEQTALALNHIISGYYPEACFLGPFPELPRLLDPYSGRQELLEHIPQALALAERRWLQLETSSAPSDAKPNAI